MILIGTWGAKLERGCLALPQPFRPAAAAGLTITRGFDRCLQAFPADTWHILATRVRELPLTANAARSLRRMIFGAAVDLAPDTLDALAIPYPLLAYARISAQALFVGCDSYFEIWSPETWRATLEAPPAHEGLSALVADLATTYAPAIMYRRADKESGRG